MPHLPNWNRAVLELRKIEGYCLDPDHPRGRHKARVFRNTIGIAREDSEWLRAQLLSGLENSEATLLSEDRFGARWRVDVPVARQGKSVVIRTLWIVQTGEDIPRFITCWVL